MDEKLFTVIRHATNRGYRVVWQDGWFTPRIQSHFNLPKRETIRAVKQLAEQRGYIARYVDVNEWDTVNRMY